MRHDVYTQNRITRNGKEYAPIELFFGKRASATFMEFGKSVYVNTPMRNRGKFDLHAETMKFLSVDDCVKGFRVWNGNKVIITRNMSPKLNVNIEYEDPSQSEQNSIPRKLPETDHKNMNYEQDNDEQETVSLRRSPRLANANLSETNSSNTELSEICEPKTYKQAISSHDKEKWIKAMSEELTSIKENKTWSLVDLPHGKSPIGCKWVFKLKKDATGKIIRYKARLVAQGFTQKFGVDYDEVFAPVAHPVTTRILLSVASKENLIVKQFDIKSAFLNGDLNEEVYMKQPPGYIEGDKVLKLHKAIYGLKQAARAWNSKKFLRTEAESVTSFVIRCFGSRNKGSVTQGIFREF